eukprot:1176034-Prorocentrum_minimum.AAC.8
MLAGTSVTSRLAAALWQTIFFLEQGDSGGLPTAAAAAVPGGGGILGARTARHPGRPEELRGVYEQRGYRGEADEEGMIHMFYRN